VAGWCLGGKKKAKPPVVGTAAPGETSVVKDLVNILVMDVVYYFLL